MQYTTVKPFVFRGVAFNTGDLFDTDKMSCEPHRAKTLMNTRYITPGYFKPEEKLSQPQKAEKQPTRQPESNKPDEANSEPDDENEPEGEEEIGEENEPEGENEPENTQEPEQPRRPSRRRS